MYTEIIEHGPYLLRPFSSNDAPFIVPVVFQVLEEYGLIPEPEGVDKDLYNIEHYYKNGFFGVVEYKGNIVGTFGMGLISQGQCEIRKMYLLPEHRGKGLGKQMLHYLLALAKENSCISVGLETASVLQEAVQLYLKNGFRLVPVPNETLRCNQVYTLNLI